MPSSKCDVCNNTFASPRGALLHKHRKHGATGDRRKRLTTRQKSAAKTTQTTKAQATPKAGVPRAKKKPVQPQALPKTNVLVHPGGQNDGDDDILVIEPKREPDVPHDNEQKQMNGFAGLVTKACAKSNLVKFHDVNTDGGNIGKITFQFLCNKCRGKQGVARCFRGRAYCVKCCGHKECD